MAPGMEQLLGELDAGFDLSLIRFLGLAFVREFLGTIR